MADTVVLGVPVTRAAAAVLAGDPRRIDRLGALVSRLVAPGAGGADPLVEWLAALPRDPAAPELTEAEIAAEVAAARADRRR